MDDLENGGGPRPVSEESVTISQYIPGVLSKDLAPSYTRKVRIDMDLYDGGYEMADGFQPFLPFDEEV